MPRLLAPAPLDLADVFRKTQAKMKSDLTMGQLFAHRPTHGAASEKQWLALLQAYLPKRYRVTPAFIVNAEGQRSWQIDLAIYDNLHSPPLFPHASGVHLPIESLYGVLEVKTIVSATEVQEIGRKLASVRALQTGREARPILTGMLSNSSLWKGARFEPLLKKALYRQAGDERLDLGCILEQGAFETGEVVTVSPPEETLIFFVLRLVARLNALGPAPPADVMSYVKTLGSFKNWT